MLRIAGVGLCLAAAGVAAAQSTEWPMYGHDPGGARFSPLKQITPQNVAKLERAWVYKTGEFGNFETTPIVVGGVMYITTQAQKIAALEPETGKELWKFDPKSRLRELRGVAYWPGDRQSGARIVFGTSDGRLMALDAKTGKPASSFGDNGTINLRAGVADNFPPSTAYSITSPPAITRT
jgi:quinoprotein glucose dehydrogenase